MEPRGQLAARRRALGFSQESLAHALEVSTQTVSRWELGTSSPRPGYLPNLAAVLNLTMAELEQVVSGNTALATKGHPVPSWLSHYASLEQGASRIHHYEPVSVPGLLQTREYTTAVERGHYVPVSDEEVEARVQARMARQAVFERQPEPPELTCVIDESVLHRVAGDHDIMRAQLDHLCTMAARPSVSLHVLPTGCGAGHCAPFGSFDLFTSAGSSSPFIVCTESLTGFSYDDTPSSIESYRLLFDHLHAVALPPSDSVDLIRTASKEHYQ